MYFSEQKKVKQSTESSFCQVPVLWAGRGREEGSVQGDNVWDDAEDGGRVGAAPVCGRVAVALPQAAGRHEATAAATAAAVGGGQGGAAPCTQLIQEHLGGGVREKPRRVQEVLVVGHCGCRRSKQGSVVMLIVS